MIRPCRSSDALQYAQALEAWATCRERAVAELERRAEHLILDHQACDATHLKAAAGRLRRSALRERAQAATLRQRMLISSGEPMRVIIEAAH